MLNSYIREEYPELDLEEIDQAGMKNIEKVEADCRRRVDKSLKASAAREEREGGATT
jgi:hypothetical protein